MEIFENWSDVLIFWSLCDGPSKRVLNTWSFWMFCLLMPKYNELQLSSLLDTRELARVIATDGGIRFWMRLMSRMWKWLDLQTKLTWLVRDMSELKMKPRFRADVLTRIVVLPREIFFLCCGVPIRSNSVLDGFSMSLLLCVQETMSLKAEERISEDWWRLAGLNEM